MMIHARQRKAQISRNPPYLTKLDRAVKGDVQDLVLHVGSEVVGLVADHEERERLANRDGVAVVQP